jgi:hypothetical protein
MLLTKDERKTLNKDEKKALRAERRAERKEERGPFLGIKLDVLESLAEDLILELVSDAIPGEEKMKEVIEELAQEADKFLRWTGLPPWLSLPLEALDGVLLQAVARSTLHPLVQRVYDELEKSGKLLSE